MSQREYEAAVAEFIRSNGITRCPTACLAPTQGSVSVTDRMVLRERAKQVEELRQEKLRNPERSISAFTRMTERESSDETALDPP